MPSSVDPWRCLWITSPCGLPTSVLSDCSDSRRNMFSQVIPAALSVSVLSGTARNPQSRTIEAKVCDMSHVSERKCRGKALIETRALSNGTCGLLKTYWFVSEVAQGSVL